VLRNDSNAQLGQVRACFAVFHKRRRAPLSSRPLEGW
jgi:hypothetical protein